MFWSSASQLIPIKTSATCRIISSLSRRTTLDLKLSQRCCWRHAFGNVPPWQWASQWHSVMHRKTCNSTYVVRYTNDIESVHALHTRSKFKPLRFSVLGLSQSKHFCHKFVRLLLATCIIMPWNHTRTEFRRPRVNRGQVCTMDRADGLVLQVCNFKRQILPEQA